MKIELHREPVIFETLRDEWNALLEKSVSRVPFLRAEYQRAWWLHRGGGGALPVNLPDDRALCNRRSAHAIQHYEAGLALLTIPLGAA